MPEIKAVPDAAPDPKAGSSRRTSGVAFPYYNLTTSIEVARAIHDKAGGSCDRVQLATFLGYKGINNGSFLSRVTAAKLFGLIDQEGDQLRITPRGQAVVAPITTAEADQAKLEAFMAVPLFRQVFEEYNGRPLPPDAGLQNLFRTKYAVVTDRVGPTVKIMLDSAEEAGLFRTAGNREKMVLPILGTRPVAPKPVAPAVADDRSLRVESSAASRGTGNGSSTIHPAILGLLNELPPVGTVLTSKKRTALIAAFTATVGFIYPEADND